MIRELARRKGLILTAVLLVVLAGILTPTLYAQCPPCGGTPQTVTTDNWTFQFIRPCLTQTTTAGGRGGGIEIRNALFRSSTAQPFRTVFHKAHIPITNVKYRNDACGPFRLWQYQESPFICTGTVPAPGRCNGSATTNCNNPPGGDVGTFCGVSVDTSDPNQVVLTSLVRAAWLRYQLEWYFYPDGSFRPAIKWTNIPHPCLVNPHLNLAYWRIDFDIEGSIPNTIEEANLWGPLAPGYWQTWDPFFVEMNRMREQFSGRWYRVRNTSTNRAYIIYPAEAWTGEYDGVAVVPGVSDIWALRYNTALQEETDDCAPPMGGTAFCSLGGSAGYWAHLSRFVDQTSDSTFLLGRDVVFWYGASQFREGVLGGTPSASDCFQITGPFLGPDPEGPAW